MNDTSPPFLRYLWIAVLVIALLGFGAASLCGGFFTIASLPEVISGRNGYATAALMMGGPSLVVGGLLTWVCFRLLRRAWRTQQPAASGDQETP